MKAQSKTKGDNKKEIRYQNINRHTDCRIGYPKIKITGGTLPDYLKTPEETYHAEGKIFVIYFTENKDSFIMHVTPFLRLLSLLSRRRHRTV